MAAAEAKKKICIFGAGAIGLYLAAGLLKKGQDVSLIARGANLAALRRQGGVRIVPLPKGSKEELVRCDVARMTADPRDVGVVDYVIVTLKAFQGYESVEQMRPLLGSHTVVVTAQNGFPWWFFHGYPSVWDTLPAEARTVEAVDPGGRQWAVLGPERVIGCVVYPATSLAEPGLCVVNSGRKFTLGEPSGQITPRAQWLSAALIAAGFEAPIRKDIRNEVWKKLIGNAIFNPLSVVMNAPMDVLTSDPALVRLVEIGMAEAMAVAGRLGVEFRITIAQRIDGARTVGGHITSMLQDFRAARPLEIGALCLAVQEIGAKLGVPTPTLDALYALTQAHQRRAAAGAKL